LKQSSKQLWWAGSDGEVDLREGRGWTGVDAPSSGRRSAAGDRRRLMQGRATVSPVRASYLFAGLDQELFLRGAARKRSLLQCSIHGLKEPDTKIQRIKTSDPTVRDLGDRGIKSPGGRPLRPMFLPPLTYKSSLLRSMSAPLLLP
jgi:hypothetical protein